MILLVDVGNTNIVLGVQKDDSYIASWRISTDAKKTSDEYAIQVMQLFEQNDLDPKGVKGVIISSVVPNIMHSLENMVRKCFGIEPVVVGPGIKTGINIKYDNPKEVGADRIVNAVAAYEIYKRAMIIIDFGTATTFCAITASGDYLGGCLLHGLFMAHTPVSLQQLLAAHRKNAIQMFRPVFHGHNLFPFRLTFRKIQISGNKLTHCTKFLFIQIVLCNYSLF